MAEALDPQQAKAWSRGKRLADDGAGMFVGTFNSPAHGYVPIVGKLEAVRLGLNSTKSTEPGAVGKVVPRLKEGVGWNNKSARITNLHVNKGGPRVYTFDVFKYNEDGTLGTAIEVRVGKKDLVPRSFDYGLKDKGSEPYIHVDAATTAILDYLNNSITGIATEHGDDFDKPVAWSNEMMDEITVRQQRFKEQREAKTREEFGATGFSATELSDYSQASPTMVSPLPEPRVNVSSNKDAFTPSANSWTGPATVSFEAHPTHTRTIIKADSRTLQALQENGVLNALQERTGVRTSALSDVDLASPRETVPPLEIHEFVQNQEPGDVATPELLMEHFFPSMPVAHDFYLPAWRYFDYELNNLVSADGTTGLLKVEKADKTIGMTAPEFKELKARRKVYVRQPNPEEAHAEPK